ncbi:hypothetical protein BKA70DRAFT_88778 [Coprinopsis sp. MPI-PUGE-AT-0042]|nr:hypothetical protein BKA70DRAFT_88778 [Coprinopsis sp. MPI-PUGE-AT-0042]
MADEEMRFGKAVSKEARAEKMPENGHLGVEVEDEGEEGQSDRPEDFQQDAKIWSLYLKEASDLAKAQTELWKTGLDSLLLFAGLFASVVSAFVIESRKELRMDDQEQLIRNIYNIQLGEKPQEDNYKPSMDDLWINGLWFTSLLITLLSAIVGVLAKSWLVKYVPLAAREDFEEAYRRWTLERSVTQWHMEWVFTMLPLFVQLAFFLFAAGFTIQCFKDHQTLGCVVLAIVGVGVLAYLLATALPLLPDGLCPFRTPLSEILIQLRKLMSKKPNATTPASDIDQESLHQVLGKIWEKELKSPKQDDVDEAVAQIARRPLTDERLESFADSYTPNIVLKRLERCMTSDYQEDLRRNEIISNHLLALSRFISHSEKTKHKHGDLKSTLKNSLDSKEPLGRWNFFTEPTLPLAFSIRVPLLLAFDQDIATTEVLEQPWEQLARALKPKHRLRFFLASCCALVTGRENLRKDLVLWPTLTSFKPRKLASKVNGEVSLRTRAMQRTLSGGASFASATR